MSFTQHVCAHEVQPSLLTLKQIDATIWQLSFKQPPLSSPRLSVQTNCRALPARIYSPELQYQLYCSNDALQQIEIVGLKNTLANTLVRVVPLKLEEQKFLLSGRDNSISLNQPAARIPAYLWLGIEHLLLGIDHVLFVLILIYIVPNIRLLIAVITSFTLAHSATLVLSSLGVLSIPQAPIEALISLSIVLLAAEALRDEKSYLTKAPWIVSALFGLLHGLGFAGALTDVGLPNDNQLSALFLFNIGIELAQIAVVMVALVISKVITNISPPMLLARITAIPIYLVGFLASYWFFERAAGILI